MIIVHIVLYFFGSWKRVRKLIICISPFLLKVLKVSHLIKYHKGSHQPAILTPSLNYFQNLFQNSSIENFYEKVGMKKNLFQHSPPTSLKFANIVKDFR